MKPINNTRYKQRSFSKDDYGREAFELILPYLFVGGTILLAFVR